MQLALAETTRGGAAPSVDHRQYRRPQRPNAPAKLVARAVQLEEVAHLRPSTLPVKTLRDRTGVQRIGATAQLLLGWIRTAAQWRPQCGAGGPLQASAAKLAELLGVTPECVWKTVKRLESLQLIAGRSVKAGREGGPYEGRDGKLSTDYNLANVYKLLPRALSHGQWQQLRLQAWAAAVARAARSGVERESSPGGAARPQANASVVQYEQSSNQRPLPGGAAAACGLAAPPGEDSLSTPDRAAWTRESKVQEALEAGLTSEDLDDLAAALEPDDFDAREALAGVRHLVFGKQVSKVAPF